MDNKFYIYFHINPIKNEIFYVGKGYNNRAFFLHNRNNFWKNYVKKYGKPIIIIVKKDISEKYAFALEKVYIKLIGRRDLGLGPLVNLTDGGEGPSGYKHSEEIINKLSKNSKGNINMLGKNHTDNTKRKISETLKSKNLSNKHTEETKKKMSESAIGKKCSEETKKKISESLKGNTNMLGKKLSEEHKLKISNTLKGSKRTFTEKHKQSLSKALKGKTSPWKGIKRGPYKKNKKKEENEQ